mgnify:CR=1 FL=1
MSKEILKTINIKKNFQHRNKSITLFKNLNLKINKGDLVALVGPSGSGKSSLLHIIGLLDEPTNGKILINNQDTSSFSNLKKDVIRSRSISIIFQDNNLLSDFTALENVYLPNLLISKEKQKSKEHAKKLIKNMGLLARINHFPNELSGGENQRIAIARALINNPDIILADEPTGALDQVNAENLINLLLEVCHKNRTTMIMVTHAHSLADKMQFRWNFDHGKLKKERA